MLIRRFLITLYVFGIILVFSRGLFLALLVVTFFHLYINEKEKIKRFSLYLILPTMLIYFGLNAYKVNTNVSNNEMVKERLAQDTATSRFGYYSFVIKSIPQAFFFGYGSKQHNPVYRRGMIDLNQIAWANGTKGGIHNMFLEVIFLRGFFVLWLLILFLFWTIKHSVSEAKKGRYFVLLPSYYILGVIIYRLVTASFLQSYCGMLIMTFVAMISGIYHRQIDTKELINNNLLFNESTSI